MIFSPWFVVVIYLIPMVGTLVAMGRRTRSVWSFGAPVRKSFPDNSVSRTLNKWSHAIRLWWAKQALGKRLNVRTVNAELGRIEYLFGHLRDYTFGVLMTGGAVYNLTMCLLVSAERLSHYFYDAFFYGVFALLSLAMYRRHVTTGFKMTEFMRVNPLVHPQEFFDHYYRRLGPLAEPIPDVAEETVNPVDVSYQTGKAAEIGYGRLAYGFYDTAIFARSAFKALDVVGLDYGRDVFDVMASLWGSRMIQLFRSRLKVTGTEKFHGLEGKVILVCNHKSHLDFVFNFFALSNTHLKNGRRIRPRYMAAKDHFVDNQFVYNGLGVGRLIEAVDMVFVDRVGKGKDAIEQAAEVLVNKDVDIAMYPQGTRAYGNLNEHRGRRDAGFYTTGSAKRLRQELGHLKKGCAFLAIDTAIEIARRGEETPVHLVFIGIEGTADLVPKASFKVRTESEVNYTVGDIVTIHPEEVQACEKPSADGPQSDAHHAYNKKIDALMHMINDKLVAALDLHTKLIERFMGDVKDKKYLETDKWLLVKNTLSKCNQNGDLLPFQVIDRIYALDPSYWQTYLEKTATILSSDQHVGAHGRAPLQTLNEEVIDFLLKTRGRLMTMAVKSEEIRAKKAS